MPISRREFAKKVIDPAEKYVKDQVMNLNLFVNASPPGIGGVNDSSKKSKLDRIIKIPEAPTTKTPNISLPNIPIEAIPDVGSLLDSAVLRKVVRNREEDYKAIHALLMIYRECLAEATEAPMSKESRRLIQGLEEYRKSGSSTGRIALDM